MDVMECWSTAEVLCVMKSFIKHATHSNTGNDVSIFKHFVFYYLAITVLIVFEVSGCYFRRQHHFESNQRNCNTTGLMSC